jgi:hypothetical protein
MAQLFEYLIASQVQISFRSVQMNSSVNVGGVQLPSFPLVSGDFARLFDIAGTISPTSTEDSGELFAMAFAHVVSAEIVPSNSIIVIPLTFAREDEAFDFTFVAAAPLLFVQLQEKPQPIRTYGRCVAYSDGAIDRPLAIGAMIRFTTMPQFIVAKRDLEIAVQATRSDVIVSTDSGPDKRQCVRPLVGEGELADSTGSTSKGTFVLDLDGIRHPTRSKVDLAVREKELHFTLRAMDKDRREYSITLDMSLQTEVYWSMLCDQWDTLAEDRIPAFLSCGLINRVHQLQVFTKTEKLKLLLTGCVLLEGSVQQSLSLEDFNSGDKFVTSVLPCQNNNIWLVSILKNFQMTMQIVFSESFEACLDQFIDHLEGAYRPLELVPYDFLRFAVELVLRKVFFTIRETRGSCMTGGKSVRTPDNCAAFLTTAFDKLTDDLSDYQTMLKQTSLFRIKLARKNGAARSEAASIKIDKAVKFEKVIEKPREEGGVSGAPKVCSGHFGKQLAATKRDGRPYTCRLEKNCLYAHVSIAGMSPEKIVQIATSMPGTMKVDFLKAINAKKK